MKIIKFIQNNFALVLIVCLAIFLRFYKLSETFIVSAETGGDLIIARNAILSHTLPLHGSVSSHTWLFFGPLYWWLLEVFSFFLSFNPLSHAILGRLCSVLTVIAVYIFVEKNINRRTALFSAFLVSISPLFMLSARIGRHDSFSILCSIVFLYILSLAEKQKLFKSFLVGLILGVGINFEYTFLLVTPVFILFVLIRKMKISLYDICKLVLGFLIPFIPLILLEVQSGKPMLSKIFLWIPYRILGFAGLIKSDIVVASFSASSYSFWKLVTDSFLIRPNLLLTVLLFVPVIYAIYIFLYKYKHKTINSGELLLALITSCYVAGLVVHTNPPIHYFSEIYFVPIILICYVANYFWTNQIIKTLFIIFIVVIAMSEAKFYFSDMWFYKNYSKIQSSYINQTAVVKKIINDSDGKAFAFARVGLFDDLPNDFADNYIYLFMYYQRQPVAKAKIKYIIYDDLKSYKIASLRHKHFTVGAVGVLKQEK